MFEVSKDTMDKWFSIFWMSWLTKRLDNTSKDNNYCFWDPICWEKCLRSVQRISKQNWYSSFQKFVFFDNNNVSISSTFRKQLFFIPKCFAKFFSSNNLELVFVFFGKWWFAEKVHIKCWWNWQKVPKNDWNSNFMC